MSSVVVSGLAQKKAGWELIPTIGFYTSISGMTEKQEYMAGSPGAKGVINSLYGQVYGRALDDEEIQELYEMHRFPSDRTEEVPLTIGGSLSIGVIEDTDDEDDVKDAIMMENGSVLYRGETDADIQFGDTYSFSVGFEPADVDADELVAELEGTHPNCRCTLTGPESDSEEDERLDESMIDEPP